MTFEGDQVTLESQCLKCPTGRLPSKANQSVGLDQLVDRHHKPTC